MTASKELSAKGNAIMSATTRSKDIGLLFKKISPDSSPLGPLTPISRATQSCRIRPNARSASSCRHRFLKFVSGHFLKLYLKKLRHSSLILAANDPYGYQLPTYHFLNSLKSNFHFQNPLYPLLSTLLQPLCFRTEQLRLVLTIQKNDSFANRIGSGTILTS